MTNEIISQKAPKRGLSGTKNKIWLDRIAAPKGRSWVLRLFFLIVAFSLFISPYSIDATSKRQVLILDIPRFDLAEVSPHYPGFMKLADSSAVGVMTTPLSDPLTPDKVCLAVNSGSQVKTSPNTYTFYDVNEKIHSLQAGNLYRNFTGKPVPVDGAVAFGLPEILQQNDKTIRYTLGLFGKLLHQNGIQTAAIGNADADIPNRYAAAMIMDQNGTIDMGAVGPETLSKDPLFPYGFRTDPDKILFYWNNFQPKAQVTVITLGDLERIERFGDFLSKSRKQYFRRLTLERYDRLLGQLISQIDLAHTLVVVFTALPPGNDLTGSSRLTPVIIKGADFKPGCISSNSTRRPGIMTCFDLPVTILEFLHIKTQGLYNGYPARTVGGDWRALVPEGLALSINYQIRWPLLTIYTYALIGLFLGAILSLIFGFHRKLLPWIVKGYLFLLTLPAVFLLEALINPLDWMAIAGWTLGLAGIIYLGAFFGSGREPFKTMGAICLFTVGIILVDLCFNGFCELKSFLGYSAVSGARFYGIGNEYMGVLLGAFIVAFSIYYEKIARYRSQVLWSVVFLITLFIIHPNLGSSVGGGITALAGLGITAFLWLRRPVRFKEIMGLAVSLAVVLTLAGIWDYYFNKNAMTHLGQLVTFISTSGFNTVGEMVVRKLQLNLRLINYTIWGPILVGLLVVVPFLYKKPPVFMAGFLTKYPGIARGFLGLTITAIIGLLINDSGIVSGATMYIYGIGMLLLVLFKEWSNKTDEN